jgi:hypothetical protein
MGKNAGSQSDYVVVQFRVSRRKNPELFERLTNGQENGVSKGLIARRLAEETLILRNHPLIQLLQANDLKGLFTKEVLNQKNQISGSPGHSTPKNNLSDNKDKLVSDVGNSSQRAPKESKTSVIADGSISDSSNSEGSSDGSAGLAMAMALLRKGKMR